MKQDGARRDSAAPAARVLVVYKRSTYQRLVRDQRNARIQELIQAGDPLVDEIIAAHEAHLITIDRTRALLRSMGVKALFRHRAETHNMQACDLVVSIGGDGTLLWASHLVGPQTPMLAINSAPKASVGYFCAGDQDALPDLLRDALAGRLPALSLSRMQVWRDGEPLSTRVLNDALFCHLCPAVTARYHIGVDALAEEQKSSGLWIGPPAGATAALRSAGGQPMLIDGDALQYLVREPYTSAAAPYRHTGGFIHPGHALVVRSKMDDGRLYLDGAHRSHPVELGAELHFSRSAEALTLLGFIGW
ncbi:MAG: NAD(+)/NADH kinase [Polyangiales bacterium]